MINLIVQILSIDEAYEESHNIDIAKGINKLPMSLKEGWEQSKRQRAWLKR